MKLFITGIAGFIGSHLAEALVALGHEVSGVDNFSSGKLSNIQNPAIKCYKCDCQDKYKLGYVINKAKPDFIYHLAATVGVSKVLDDPKKCIENNIDSLKTVVSFGIPGIFASTSEVYGKNSKIVSEDADLIYSSKSRWSYATSKIIGEYIVQQTDGWKSVRFFNVIGPRQSTSYGAVLPNFVNNAINDEPLQVYGHGMQVRTFLDVRDCAQILDILRDKCFDVVNVAGDTALSISDLAEKVIETLRSSSKFEYISYNKVYSDGFEECRYRVPDLTKLNSLIGNFVYRDFKQSIKDLAEQIKSTQVPTVTV